MSTLAIDRAALPDTLLPAIGVGRIRTESDADRVMLAPAETVNAMATKAETGTPDDDGGYFDENGKVINPDDYDSETDYINAIPGMADYLIKMMNAPDSEFTPVPKEWFNVSG